jgi:hypothetical protein
MGPDCNHDVNQAAPRIATGRMLKNASPWSCEIIGCSDAAELTLLPENTLFRKDGRRDGRCNLSGSRARPCRLRGHNKAPSIRNAETKRRASVRFRLGRDAPTVALNDACRDRQADPCAFVLIRVV